MSEYDEQCAVVEWFKLFYPKYEGCIISSENGAHLAGSKGQRTAKIARAKKAGMKPGVSDLFIAVPRGNFSGLWIEMKDKGKNKTSVSQLQIEHLMLMVTMGYASNWCAGANEAIAVISDYMSEGLL